MVAAMALPLVKRKTSVPDEVPYRSSRETAIRARSREDQSLMGRHPYI
jgi:hypothetical protein